MGCKNYFLSSFLTAYFNSAVDKNEPTNYVDVLAKYLIELGWTKDRLQAIAFADTLIINMGYIKAKDYIESSSARYLHTLVTVLAIIKVTNEGTEVEKDVYYAVADSLVLGIKDMMGSLTKQLDDITKLIFQWEIIRADFKKEIKLLYTKLKDEGHDEISEKLMEYLCCTIQFKNGYEPS